jgi:hypothetical protein
MTRIGIFIKEVSLKEKVKQRLKKEPLQKKKPQLLNMEDINIRF